MTFKLNNIILQKQMLNHLHNMDDGGQALGEECRHIQTSRWIMHI